MPCSLLRNPLAPRWQTLTICVTRSAREARRPSWMPCVMRRAPRQRWCCTSNQFEELFTSCASDDRGAFIDLLRELAATARMEWLRIVMSMRWDYYNLCSSHAAFFELVERGKHRIAAMERSQILACVIEPLKLAGIDNAQAQSFGEVVLNDASGEPGDLALIQMALHQTWRRMKAAGGDLLAAYADAGRVSGALAKEAERVYQEVLADADENWHRPCSCGW